MARSERYDLVVLGGGTGGLVSARIAAAAGARVALIERDRTGGDCLWTGCVPSKALLAAAELAQRMRRARSVGLAPIEPEIDFAAVMRHVHAAQKTIAPGDSPERLRSEGVDVIEAEGRFLAHGLVAAGERQLRCRVAIVATGSEPLVPRIVGLEAARPLTNETLWELEALSERLVVLGGGPVGCEFGQAFARLGSRVTLVEMADRLLLKEEPRAGALVARVLEEEGVDLRLGEAADAVTRNGAGARLVVGAEELPFDRVLVAAGRAPSTDGLGLDVIDVRTDDRGAVLVDERLRTSARGVYAVGDVTGALPFTHVAAHHARIAAPNALFGLRRKVDYAAVPWATFTDPEVGRIGLTEQEARERWGDRVVVAEFDYSTSDRAIAAGQARGFAKLVGDRRGRLVGATVAAPAGGEVIAALAGHVAARAKIDAVSRQVHAYPTLSEGPARAADQYVIRKLLRPRMRALTRPALAALRAVQR
jgi:pyruvate/2-oxoglutarate dehydrogenase complex dihydrolipoamide dehydrogenase (E3) component